MEFNILIKNTLTDQKKPPEMGSMRWDKANLIKLSGNHLNFNYFSKHSNRNVIIRCDCSKINSLMTPQNHDNLFVVDGQDCKCTGTPPEYMDSDMDMFNDYDLVHLSSKEK